MWTQHSPLLTPIHFPHLLPHANNRWSSWPTDLCNSYYPQLVCVIETRHEVEGNGTISLWTGESALLFRRTVIRTFQLVSCYWLIRIEQFMLYYFLALVWTAVKNCITGVQSQAETVETVSLSQLENACEIHTASFSSHNSKGLLRLPSLFTYRDQFLRHYYHHTETNFFRFWADWYPKFAGQNRGGITRYLYWKFSWSPLFSQGECWQKPWRSPSEYLPTRNSWCLHLSDSWSCNLCILNDLINNLEAVCLL